MNNMNFNPNMFNMINPQMMRTALGNIDNMSDDQLRAMLNSSGLKVEPQVYRQMAKQMANSSDADLDQMKNKSKDMFSNNYGSTNIPSTSQSTQPSSNHSNLSSNHTIDESQFKKKSSLEKLEAIKLEGNAFFKQGKYKQAKEKYYEMLNEIEYGSEKVSDTGNLLRIARLNIANCHLKLEDYELVIHECNKVLKKEANFKAYYRSGVAHYMKKRFDKSEDCFVNAKRMECSIEEKKQIEDYLEKIAKEKKPDVKISQSVNEPNTINQPKTINESNINSNKTKEYNDEKSKDSKIVLNSNPGKTESTVEKILHEEKKPIEKKVNEHDEIKVEDINSRQHNVKDPNCTHNHSQCNPSVKNNSMFEESKRRIENMVRLFYLL